MSRLRHDALGASLAIALGAALAPRSAHAHIELLEPSPRAPGRSPDPNANLKEGPCGQVENTRTENVHVFAPGQTISVRWTEYVSHRSYYRVAFDADGDDAFPIFPGPGTSAVGHDPTQACPVDGRVILAYDLTDGPGGEHSLDVTLPEVECENCTLQVIQYMYDTSRPYYFQCADLALRGPSSDAGLPEAGAPDGAPAPAFEAAPACSAPLPPRPRSDAGPSLEPEPDPDPDPANTDEPGVDPPMTALPAREKKAGCGLSGRAARASSASELALGSALLALCAFRPRSAARAPKRR